jgi:hypothetical protein
VTWIRPADEPSHARRLPLSESATVSQVTGGRQSLAWPFVAGVVLAAPVIAVSWPPCSDLALHAGMVALLAHHGDPAFAPAGLYELALGHANQLFYFLAWPVALAVGAEVACRFVLAGTIAGSLVAAGHLATHLGRTRWAALAVAPAVVGWSFYWGFAPQMLGLALWMAALPLLDRDAQSATAWGAARSSVVMVLLGLGHVTSLLCACLATTIFALTRGVDRRTLLRLTPAALGLSLVVGEDRWERHVATPFARLLASQVLWHPISRKLSGLVAYVAGGHGTIPETVVGLLVLMAAGVWSVPERTPRDRLAPPASLSRRLEDGRFMLLAGALFVAYLVLPYSTNFGAFLYVRFLGPAFVLAILLTAPPRGTRGPLVLAPALALFGAPILSALPQLQAAEQQSKAIEPILARVEPDSAVAVLHFGKYERALLFDPTSLGNRVLARGGGRLLSSFTEYPIAPVVIRPDRRWDSMLLRTSEKSGLFEPEVDLTRIRWVVAHVHEPPITPLVIRALSREADLIDASGEWLLFRSTLPTVPLDSPDGPSSPQAETLQDRVTRVLREHGLP